MKPTIAQFLNIKEFPFKIYDSNGNVIYCENSYGDWYKQEFDSNGNKLYLEDSFGTVNHYQSPCEDKVVEIEGVKYKLSKL